MLKGTGVNRLAEASWDCQYPMNDKFNTGQVGDDAFFASQYQWRSGLDPQR